LTFQIAGANERNSVERTSRSPCGPVTQVGVAGALLVGPAEEVLLGAAPAEDDGALPPAR
jgi:hypothetical protein